MYPDCFRYWGKASPAEGLSEVPCHLLAYHSLDVAAVGFELFARDRAVIGRIAVPLGLEPEALLRFLVYSLAVHDIGKFARAFQGLVWPEGVDLVPPDTRMSYSLRHDALGALAWSECLEPRLRREGGCGLPEGASLSLTARRSTARWLTCFFGHHGKPVGASNAVTTDWFLEGDLEAAWSFVNEVADLLAPKWPLTELGDRHWRDHVLPPVTWQIAGLATVCDWLGSDQSVFPYVAEPMPLRDYWEGIALPRAKQAVTRSGLGARPGVRAFPGFREAFGFAPTPLQDWAQTAPIGNGPQLFLLEDVTGSGKTEAALAVVHRLLSAGCGQGLYFGLPTMATSNAMYARLGAVYRHIYTDDTNPSMVLAHGARQLNETFRRSLVPEPSSDGAYAQGDASASIECRDWLADNRKKALLADVGVGTIDQALLGVLPRRHQSLRLLGLAGKVLVVDEVHAYDTYTSTLLCRLLSAHARAGGSVVLLSATIPHALRRRLVDAWLAARNADAAPALESTAFPLATHVDGDVALEYPLEATSRRELPVTFVSDAAEAAAIILGAARDGRCVCWIRNTVDDAIDAYELVRARLDEPENAMLFHARFVMGDRQRIEEAALRRFGSDSGSGDRAGSILIATQVVEQSLDLDFDALVSDLAPVDLLIQRAGRLHRHRRNSIGDRVPPSEEDGRSRPQLRVLAPSWTEEPAPDWLRRHLPGTSYVYPDAGRLWLTCRVLREQGGIRLPDNVRELLEGVYGPDAAIPCGLEDASLESDGAARAHASGALFNALDLAEGYSPESGNGTWEDDQDIGTRLSEEPSMPVVLLRVDEEDGLQPWHDDAALPWAMSTVRLRQSQVNRLPELPERFGESLDQLRERHPSLKHAVFWLPDATQSVAPFYDPCLGAVIARAAARGTAPRSEDEPD